MQLKNRIGPWSPHHVHTLEHNSLHLCMLVRYREGTGRFRWICSYMDPSAVLPMPIWGQGRGGRSITHRSCYKSSTWGRVSPFPPNSDRDHLHQVWLLRVHRQGCLNEHEITRAILGPDPKINGKTPTDFKKLWVMPFDFTVTHTWNQGELHPWSSSSGKRTEDPVKT